MGQQLSVLDTMFLVLEQNDESAHMHIGVTLVFEALPGGGTPDVEDLKAFVAQRIGAAPRFADRLSEPHAGNLSWLTWEQVEGFDAADHIRHATLPAPGDEVALQEWLGDFWSHRLDRHRPLWEMVLLDGLEGGRWALATKTHHCLMDGAGAADLSDLLLDTAPDSEPMPPHPLEREEPTGRGGRFWLNPAMLVRGARVGLDVARRPRATLEHLAAMGQFVTHASAPLTSINGEMGAMRHYRAIEVELAQLQEVRARLGGTLNDVVLAVCTGAVRHLLLSRGETLPDRELIAQVPVNVRDDGHQHETGNQIATLLVELPVQIADPLSRYARVRRRAEARKQGSQVVGGATLTDVVGMAPPLAGALVARALGRVFNLTITNVRGPREPRFTFGAPLARILPLVPLLGDHALGVAVVTYNGRVTFGINADRLGAPDVDVLADGLRAALQELQVPERAAVG